jgi:hypothetical protein
LENNGFMIPSANCTPHPRRAPGALLDRRFHGIVCATLLLGLVFLGTARVANAQANPGDPLFCQPVEGTTFLIVNGGTGVFSANADCYGNNPATFDTDTTIPTSQGGIMTKTPGTANYTYTPPTPTFTGLDTFPLHVLYSYNKVGGIGSAGGSTFPGSPATLTITLNVISAGPTLTAGGPTLVPVPTGSVTGCSPVGNSQNGPLPGAIFGCVTGIEAGSVSPSHGTLLVSGNTLQYTPTPGYNGPDTFSYRAQGVDNNGTKRLNSGETVVQATVTSGTGPTTAVGTPALGTWMMLVLCAGMLLLGVKAAARHAT